MKVYNADVQPPDYNDPIHESSKIYRDKVKDFLIKNGYVGSNTGKIFSYPVADGYASYMVAEGLSRQFFLIHLRDYDAYSLPAAHIRGLTKKEVLDSIDRRENFKSIFNKE